MIDRGIPDREGWPDDVLNRLVSWEQGDVVERPPFFYFADPTAPIWQATVLLSQESHESEVVIPPDAVLPPFGLITTQTCDIGEEDAARPVKPWVQIAPIYALSDTGWSKKVRRGGGPRHWLHVPNLPGDETWVADFRIEVPVEKGWLARQTKIVGFDSSEDRLAVGRRLSSIRGRIAFSGALNDSVIAPLHRFMEAQGGTDDEPDDLGDELNDKVVEVTISVDDPTAAGVAQLTVLVRELLSPEAAERLREWWDTARQNAEDVDIRLLPLQIEREDTFTVQQYRRGHSIWLK
jgi:hypothetical protein